MRDIAAQRPSMLVQATRNRRCYVQCPRFYLTVPEWIF